jgi:enamine deaminase RidA (YjgF/YER057c/UK114 family)
MYSCATSATSRYPDRAMSAGLPRPGVRSGSPFEEAFGFRRAVADGDRVLVSGTAPIEPDGSCAEGAEAQADRCLAIIAEALRALGAGPDDVVRTRMYIVDRVDAEAVGRAHHRAFGVARPAATMVVVAGLLDPRWRVEVEAEAVIRGASRSSGASARSRWGRRSNPGAGVMRLPRAREVCRFLTGRGRCTRRG